LGVKTMTIVPPRSTRQAAPAKSMRADSAVMVTSFTVENMVVMKKKKAV
jgi:hypothetical protein